MGSKYGPKQRKLLNSSVMRDECSLPHAAFRRCPAPSRRWRGCIWKSWCSCAAAPLASRESGHAHPLGDALIFCEVSRVHGVHSHGPSMHFLHTRIWPRTGNGIQSTDRQLACSNQETHCSSRRLEEHTFLSSLYPSPPPSHLGRARALLVGGGCLRAGKGTASPLLRY